MRVPLLKVTRYPIACLEKIYKYWTFDVVDNDTANPFAYAFSLWQMTLSHLALSKIYASIESEVNLLFVYMKQMEWYKIHLREFFDIPRLFMTWAVLQSPTFSYFSLQHIVPIAVLNTLSTLRLSYFVWNISLRLTSTRRRKLVSKKPKLKYFSCERKDQYLGMKARITYREIVEINN